MSAAQPIIRGGTAWIDLPCAPARVEIFDMWWISLMPAMGPGIGLGRYSVPICSTCGKPVEAIMMAEKDPRAMVQFHCHGQVEYTIRRRDGKWELLDGDPRRSDLPGNQRSRL